MKRKSNSQIVIVVSLVLMLILGACRTTTVSTPTGLATETTETNAVSSLEIPSPKEAYSVVIGRLISEETGKAPQKAVFLAKNITADEEDLPAYLSFSHMNSPRAVVDENGYFYFEDVPEGQFAILLFEPAGNHYFIDNGKTDDTRDYLWVNAVPNETLDMGTIYVP